MGISGNVLDVIKSCLGRSEIIYGTFDIDGDRLLQKGISCGSMSLSQYISVGLKTIDNQFSAAIR